MTRRLLSKPIHAKERNDPPSANQGLSTPKPRRSYAISPNDETHPPPVLPFALAQNTNPKDIARSDIIS